MAYRNIFPAHILGLVRKTILQVLIGLMGGGVAVLAQQAGDGHTPASVATVSDASPAANAAMSAQINSAPSGTAPADQATTPADQSAAPAAAKVSYYTKDKKGKEVYTGPSTVVVLAPAPMLDGEGKQRVDPDGKLMFNVPVKQIRDKKGHPVWDEKNAPVFETATNLGYTEKGKKIEAKKIKPPKMTPVSISAGTLTVDGWTGKARLNYDIADLKYIYIYAPGIGTTIVSKDPFPGAKEQPQAFNAKTLSITVEGHPIQLYSEKPLLGKKPLPAWVVVDRGFLLPAKFPVFGYGATTKSPYMWPGAKDSVVAKGVAPPPPLPSDVRPTLLLAACPAGMMRKAGPVVLPGQKAPDQPCVPIKAPAASAASTSATTTTSTTTAPAAQNP